MAIEDITAQEFLDATWFACGNSAAKPAYKQTLEELKRSPATKQKLVFELLAMIPKLIDSRQAPSDAFLWAARWRRCVEPPRIPEYLAMLESAVTRYFEAIRTLPADVDVHPWVLPLGVGLDAISELDGPGYTRFLNALQQECGDPATDPRKHILDAAISDGKRRDQ